MGGDKRRCGGRGPGEEDGQTGGRAAAAWGSGRYYGLGLWACLCAHPQLTRGARPMQDDRPINLPFFLFLVFFFCEDFLFSSIFLSWI